MTYRLDRRFVLRAIGLNLIVAGVSAALAFLLSFVGALAWVFGVLAVMAVLNALRVLGMPPVVARTDANEVRVGGFLTVRPVHVAWSSVEDATTDGGRLFFDRVDGEVLAFPLAYVGGRADELVVDVYHRLNTANGYQRFDPS
ncbi:hypothetical protein [Aeromicrobium sp.]|uniref:hypothetical protein n=1 Tax=Aeromicrobium sp. TaxID=1871063 RepID=UPI0019855850|nr:hypothetical protein [Aeromicrobium sp.]MBC7632198.1 hypothetical protein [Aeromicrobium sp.]